MDEEYKEEQDALEQTENKIESAEKKEIERLNSLNNEYANYHTYGDYDLVDEKKELLDEIKSVSRYREFLAKLKPCPYFGRIDLEREENNSYIEETYYIGDTTLSIDNDEIILDWRSPIGTCYRATEQTSYSVNDQQYSLLLRRALFIKDAQLVKCSTQYDSNQASLTGEVIDPFLLEVLKDKRRQHRVTDIISTIQSNQNMIISRPKEESFAVQGCAGSGKTMILLHRLSYLRYNYKKEMPIEGIKIITPNQDFNAFINELSVQLEIDNIQKLSVEEYYIDLIKRYNRNAEVDNKVESESSIKEDLLVDIYSEEYVHKLEEHYHNIWNNIISNIKEEQLAESFRLHNITFPGTKDHTAVCASNLRNGILKIIAETTSRQENNADKRERILNLKRELQKKEKLYSQSKEMLSVIKNHLCKKLQTIEGSLKDKIQILSDSLKPMVQRMQELSDNNGKSLTEKNRIEKELNWINSHYEVYSNYDSFILEKEDEITKLIASICSSIIQRIKDADRKLNGSPKYNFIQRNREIKNRNHILNEFSSTVKKRLDSLISEREDGLKKAINDSNIQFEEYNDLKKNKEKAEHEIALLNNELNSISAGISTIVKEDSFGRDMILEIDSSNEIQTILDDYQNLGVNLVKQKEEIEKANKTIATITEQILPDFNDDISFLTSCADSLSDLLPDRLSISLAEQELQEVYNRHSQSFSDVNYRHKLYTQLLIYSWCYPQMSRKDYFLNIDEAQDISVEEYKLLRRINGNNCAFNLYGDVNQSLLYSRSIVYWEDLCDIVSNKVYELNENYRNTIEITEYCNTRLNASILPIGIKGEFVLECNINDAIAKFIDLKNKASIYRTAIIVHKVDDVLKTLLPESIYGNLFSWYKLDINRISVLTVEATKGLEFDAVIVIENEMEQNELYIAYTRALDNLIVVRE